MACRSGGASGLHRAGEQHLLAAGGLERTGDLHGPAPGVQGRGEFFQAVAGGPAGRGIVHHRNRPFLRAEGDGGREEQGGNQEGRQAHRGWVTIAG